MLSSKTYQEYMSKERDSCCLLQKLLSNENFETMCQKNATPAVRSRNNSTAMPSIAARPFVSSARGVNTPVNNDRPSVPCMQKLQLGMHVISLDVLEPECSHSQHASLPKNKDDLAFGDLAIGDRSPNAMERSPSSMEQAAFVT